MELDAKICQALLWDHHVEEGMVSGWYNTCKFWLYSRSKQILRSIRLLMLAV